MLFEHGRPLSHLYFPVSSIVSLQCDLKDGTSSEFALTGNEGVVGFFVFMGTKSSISNAVVIREGLAYRFSAEMLLAEFNHSGAFRRFQALDLALHAGGDDGGVAKSGVPSSPLH